MMMDKIDVIIKRLEKMEQRSLQDQNVVMKEKMDEHFNRIKKIESDMAIKQVY